jgi:hypothetical protein
MAMKPSDVRQLHQQRVVGSASPGEPRGAAAAFPTVLTDDSPWPKLLLVLLLVLLFYLPNFAQIRIETGIRGLNVANVLCLLALFALMKRPAPASEPPPLKVAIAVFVAAVTWGLVVVLVQDRSRWVDDVTVYKNQVFYILLFFLYYYGVRDVATLRRVMAVMLFVVFTSSYLGLRQAMDYGMGSFNETRRVAAPFGWGYTNANRSAIFFCIYLQLVLAILLFRTSKPWLRLACLGILVLGIISVFHTFSRQAYFIMALMILLLALRRSILVALLAVFALYHYELWVPESVVERVVMTKRDPFEMSAPREPLPTFDPLAGLNAPIGKAIGTSASGSASAAAPPPSDRQYDESTESRMIIWEGAGNLIIAQPWGIGFNRFKDRIGEHVPASMAGKDAHNYYVLLTTESGVLAPLGLLLLLGALLRLGLQLASFREDEECRTLGIGFAAATMAVALGNVYGSRFIDGDVMGVYWIFAAMVARLLVIKRAELRAKAAPRRPGDAAAIANAEVNREVNPEAAGGAASSLPLPARSPALTPHPPRGPSRFF